MPVEVRTYWLSFAENGFLGVCVVDVDEIDALLVLDEMREQFPNAKEGAEWVMAAARKAHLRGCNPGGEVMSLMLPREDPKVMALPRYKLLSKEECKNLGVGEMVNPYDEGYEAERITEDDDE